MLQELHDMASDPDDEHTHIITSFNDMAGLVEKMSATTCDAPAVVDSGKEVTLIIEDCEVCALRVCGEGCVCAAKGVCTSSQWASECTCQPSFACTQACAEGGQAEIV